MIIATDVWGQTYTWKQKASLPGIDRWGAYKFVIGNFGYVGGGYNNGSLSDFWQYDPTNDAWTQKSNCPMATRTAGSFAINGLGYVVGGVALPGNTITDLMYQYNPVNNTWTQKANYPGNPIYGAASFAVGGKGYFGVGNGGSATGPYYNEFYEYNPASNIWTQKATFPGSGRYGTHGVASLNYGYVGFGLDENTNLFFDDWYQYNPVSNTWSQKQSYPIALSNPSSFFINGKIYLGTGHSNVAVFDDIYSYDDVSNTWTFENNYLAGQRWLTFGFSINNKGYFGTGTDSSNTNTYSEFYEFSPDESQDSIRCITLKPDSIRGKDAQVLSGLPNSNVEPHQEFLVCAWTCQGNPCNDRELIQFDMSVIPSNATLVSATLDLFANPAPVTIPAANYGVNNSFYIRRITSTWDENTVTWSTQPTVTTQNQIIVPQSTISNQDYSIDVTSLVYDMINDPLNSYGFMFRLVNETPYNGRNFASSDHADSTKWPSITYCFVLSTGINHTTVANDYFNVYPSVFSNQIQLEFLSSTQKAQVEIMDISGKVVFEKILSCHPNEQQILTITEDELSNLRENGVYIMRFIGNNKIVTKKLIKVKM